MKNFRKLFSLIFTLLVSTMVLTSCDGAKKETIATKMSDTQLEAAIETDNCHYICPTCHNCMNAKCKEVGHNVKCSGHQGTQKCEYECPYCGKCMNANCTQEGHSNKCQGHENDAPIVANKHLLLEKDGSYGGTLNKSVFGEGAPLNGELDEQEKGYYAVNDFFNSKCTNTRAIITNFSMYQQTMAHSDGIACALSIMNHDGVVEKTELDELRMVRRSELINNKKVYNNGTNADQLVNLFQAYGYNAKNITSEMPSDKAAQTNYFRDAIKSHKYVMIRWQYGIYYQWFIVIGADDTGDTSANQDAYILGNPFDASDHYQDGYTVVGSRRFNNWFRKVEKSGKTVISRESILIDAKTPFDLTITGEDNIKTYPEVPELHLMFNSDGSYGGTLDKDEYGNGNALNMGEVLNATDYNYFAYPDLHNYKDDSTRYICSGYRAFIQSMASSCNMCSILSILDYYDHDWSNVHNNTYVLKRNKQIKGSARHYSNGSQVFPAITDNQNELKQEALVTIYCARRSYFYDDLTHKFNNYGGVGASSLHYVPSGLGYDSKVDTKMAPNFTSICSGWGSYTQDDYLSKGDSCMMFPTYAKFLSFVKGHLKKHEPISTGWNPIGGHYTAIFGFDDMGTSSIYDDVIMIADSSDCSDQYVDGYTVYPAQQFYAQWINGSGTTNQMFVVFSDK